MGSITNTIKELFGIELEVHIDRIDLIDEEDDKIGIFYFDSQNIDVYFTKPNTGMEDHLEVKKKLDEVLPYLKGEIDG